MGYVVHRVSSGPDRKEENLPPDLGFTQQMFVEWNADRLKISVDESRTRYFDSWAALKNGHSGTEYRDFDLLCNRLLRVFYEDGEKETFESHQFYGAIHFLRMLSYPEPQWTFNDPVIQVLKSYSDVSILDFGCGLAQQSRGLAHYLSRGGAKVHVVLADIPTVRKEFLIWLGKRTGIPTTFLDCTAEKPIPELPQCEVCFATEFFEHVHDPLRYFEAIHFALRNDALLVTNISDHEKEFMHVSPNLECLRSRMRALGYLELRPNTLFKKDSQKLAIS